MAEGRRPAFILMALLSMLGCGSRSGLYGEAFEDAVGAVYPWEPGAGTLRARRVRECVQDWQTLYEDEGQVPTALAVTADEVIFSVGSL